MRPWHNWLHCTGSTYGAWLRGDPRGWRARHHREHVEGDYRSPPAPGTYDALHEQSRRLVKRPGVTLSWEARVVACRVMVKAMGFHEVQVADLMSGRGTGTRSRGSCRSTTSRGLSSRWSATRTATRRLMGVAKKESARELSRQKLAEPGGVWAGGCGRRFIRDERHFDTVCKYIPVHAKQGAAVYSLLFGGS